MGEACGGVDVKGGLWRGRYRWRDGYGGRLVEGWIWGACGEVDIGGGMDMSGLVEGRGVDMGEACGGVDMGEVVEGWGACGGVDMGEDCGGWIWGACGGVDIGGGVDMGGLVEGWIWWRFMEG